MMVVSFGTTAFSIKSIQFIDGKILELCLQSAFYLLSALALKP